MIGARSNLTAGTCRVSGETFYEDFSELLSEDSQGLFSSGEVNWVGISPSPEDFGKTIEWFTETPEGQAFGVLYQSIYTCDHSFMTYITASSK